MNTSLRHALTLVVMMALAHTSLCSAAQLTVFASSAVSAAMHGLVPPFERDTGDTLTMRYDTTSALKSDIENGAAFDVAILTAAANESLIGSGKTVAAASNAIARSGIGVVVRVGAPKPDISTAEAFRRALLSAKSVAFTANGASGTYFEALLQRLGIADSINAKALRPPGGTVGDLVAHGEAELGVQQISELLPVPGIDYVGPLPPDYQNYTIFSASLGAHAKDELAGKALIAFLMTPTALKMFTANGMEAP